MTIKHHWLSTAAIALPILVLATQAQAQDTGPQAGSTSPAAATTDAPATATNAALPSASTEVGEIVVTAQKRSENLQKVPIVVTAVSGAQLASTGVTNLTGLITLAPGLNYRTNTGAFQPVLRGIGTTSNVVENPVALYIDGVYLPNQREALRELPDVDQVTVLKGPQGTLFGRNTTGGVIQITTRPPTHDLRFQATAGIDNYATFRGGLFVSGGLASDIVGSLSASYAAQGKGYGTNFTTGEDTFRLLHSIDLRGKLLFSPSASTDVTLIADYMDRKERTFSSVPYPGTRFPLPIPGPEGKQDTYSPIESYTAFRGGGISGTISQDLGFAKLVSITSYRRGTTSFLFDDIPAGVPILYAGPGDGNGPNKDFTEEVQLVSPSGKRFTWTTGAFYFFSRTSYDPFGRYFNVGLYGPAGPPGGANRVTQTTGSERVESIAPFAQTTLELFDQTHLTLGGRYTFERRLLQNGSVVTTRYNGSTSTALFSQPPLTIEKPTWRVALDHQFTPDVMGYISYNRGIKSGGFNILNPVNPSYLPERLDAYEAGIKSELLDRRLRLNLGAFYYDYSNVQVVQYLATVQTIVNGAQARLYGVDIDFNARLTSELSLNGGLELLHAAFTKYTNAVGSIVKPTGGATLIAVDASGRRLPGAEKVSATLSVDYETRVSFGTIHADVTGNYHGDSYFEADNFLRQPAYVLLNTSLEWRSSNDNLSLMVWGRNLLDKKIITNASTQAPGYPATYAQPPRTFGVTGKVKL